MKWTSGIVAAFGCKDKWFIAQSTTHYEAAR